MSFAGQPAQGGAVVGGGVGTGVVGGGVGAGVETFVDSDKNIASEFAQPVFDTYRYVSLYTFSPRPVHPWQLPLWSFGAETLKS